MSRSIRGYSSANLTIESLSLLGIDVTTIDATTGNIITLNSTTVNATNANITNVSIGTLTIDNATVNQLLTANNITTSGTITANGNVILNSLPLDNSDNNERYITFQGVGNVLHADSKLTFNPSTNTLTIIGLSCQDITASGTISGATISGTFNIVAENKTGNIDYPISFHDTSTDRVSIGDASYLSSFTFNPSTRTMVLENGQITNATITLGNIATANITDANINANSRSDDVEYKVVLLRDTDNRICEDSSNNITYNPLNERLTVVKTTTTNLKIGQLLTTSNDTFYPCMFQGNNDDISRAPLLANFHYNPSQLKLKIDNVEVTDDLTVTDALTVTGRTDLGNIVSINALSSVNSNTTYPFLIWDNTNTNNRTIRVDTSNLYYDTTNNTLYAPNFSGSFNITVSTRSDSTDYPMLFYDTSTSDICTDSAPTQIAYNPNSNTLKLSNVTINSEAVLTNTPEATSSSFFNILFKNANNQIRIGQTASHPFQFRPSNGTLLTTTVDATTLQTTTLNVTGTATFSNSIIQPIDTDGTNNDYTLVFYDTTTSSLKRDTNPAQLVYNPSNNTISCRNIEVALDTTTQDLTVTGTLDATLNPNDASTTATMRFLGYDPAFGINKKSNSTTVFGTGIFTAKEFIKTEQFIADQFIVNGSTLPLNYVSAYSCQEWDTNIGNFGNDDYIVLNRTASEGGSPTVYQYGANISSGTSPVVVRSAINYGQTGSNAHWNLSNNSYAGMWYVDVTCVFQNLKTGSGDRMIPYIRIQKYDGSSWNEQRQLSVGMQYVRYTAGEASSLRIQGPCYLEDTNDLLRIYTKLEIGNNVSPPAFSDVASSTEWAGLQINISMRYLGKADSVANSEVINAL